MKAIDPAKVSALVSRMCEAAREEGCNMGEVAQAARAVFVSARAFVRRGVDGLVDDALGESAEEQ